MSASTSILVLFGLACADPCPLDEARRAQVEQRVVREIGARGFEVRPAAPDDLRPTGPDASVTPRDEARQRSVSRVVVLDYAAAQNQLWVTHFVRGTIGPWSVLRHPCTPEAEDPCPGLESALRGGFRPRRADDVDFVGLLRGAGPRVGVCVRAEDRVPPALRQFGRVELEIEVTADGLVRVAAIAPARAARGKLGACLRRAFASAEVGPFEGEPVRMRIPLDL